MQALDLPIRDPFGWFTGIHWLSKCGPWMSRILIMWELVSNAYSQAWHRSAELETLGLGPRIGISTNLPDDSATYYRLRTLL